MDLSIISKNNEKIKYVKKLNANKNFRKEEKKFIIEGIRLCYEAFLSKVTTNEVFYTEKVFKKFSSKIKDIIKYSKEAYIISENIMKIISETESPQGILCVCEKLDKHFGLNTISNMEKFIILENLQDPNNMGTILRTAEALGISFVIISNDCCDIYNSKVLRGSMGAVFRLKIFFSDNLVKDIKILQKENIKIYASVPSKTAKSVLDIGFNKLFGFGIVIGNEGNGISRPVIDVCDEKIKIPMTEKAESLNAAMAAGILMWEIMRNSKE